MLSSEVGDDLDQVEAVQRKVDDFQKVHVHLKTDIKIMQLCT